MLTAATIGKYRVAADGGVTGGVWVAIGATITGVMGACGIWLANRLIGKAAVQTSLSGGFKILFEEQRAMISMLHETIADLSTKLDKSDNDRFALLGEVRQLRQALESAGIARKDMNLDMNRITQPFEDLKP